MTRRSIFDISPVAARRVKDPIARLEMQKRELERRYLAQQKDYVRDGQAEQWYQNQFARLDEEIAHIKEERAEQNFGYQKDD